VPPSAKRTVRKGTKTLAPPPRRLALPAPATHFDGPVYALAASGSNVYAAAGQNVIYSPTGGIGWQKVKGLDPSEWRYIAVQGQSVVVGSLRSLALSKDGGHTWKTIASPTTVTLLRAVSMDDSGAIWAGGREGLVVSTDEGATWSAVHANYINDVNNIFFDSAAKRVLVTVNRPTLVFSISVPDHKFNYLETGWNLRFVRPVGDRLLGATFYDGIVLQPKTTTSASATPLQ